MSEGTESIGAGETEAQVELEGQEPETQAQEAPKDEDGLTGTESIRELAQKAFEKEAAKAESAGDKGEKDGQTPEKAPEAGPEGQKPQGKDEIAPEIAPPARLSAAEKETFNKMPRKLRPAVARMFQEHERQFTRAQTEWNRAVGESKHLLEAVRPYYVQHPELAENGFTESTFIAALVAKHSKLADPKTSKAEYIKLGRELGFDPATINEKNEAGSGANTDISGHPQFIALQNQVSQLIGLQQQSVQSRIEQTGSQIATEMQSVIDEKDQFGRYRYPELHDAEFLQATKPLVSALAATMPYSEALKRAHAALTGNSAGLNQTGLPASNTTNRALAAASSVRGRSGVQGTGSSMPEKIPNNTRDIAQMAFNELVRGG